MYAGLPYPDINPVAFQLGWIVIRWYSLAYIFGLIGAWLLARKMSRASQSTFTVLKIDDFLLWATLGIILGGRLGYVLFYNLPYYLEFPSQILAVWEGGMSFHGGLIGVIVAAALFSWKKQISLLSMGDIIACVAPIGLFLGRLANFVNGELYGRVTHSVPWAVIFPDGGPLPRHPSQLYEALLEGLVLFAVLNTLWWFVPRYRNRPGFMSGLFFLLYGAFRFGIEFCREPDANLGFVLGSLSMGQMLCIPMMLFGLWLILKSRPANAMKQIKDVDL